MESNSRDSGRKNSRADPWGEILFSKPERIPQDLDRFGIQNQSSQIRQRVLVSAHHLCVQQT